MRMFRFVLFVRMFFLNLIIGECTGMDLRENPIVIVCIKIQRECGLPVVVQAGAFVCFVSGTVQCWQKQSREDRED